ncbi:hypothetical protein [Aliivibrio finisterrensis]|uniref:hypothetical protein n=1 Tax=Aliivibrio finisterrensis TaxID=511998 RepID=UPI0013ED57F7|nr:hypothetical protein [Aliivibrio finisterrensis]
MAFNPNAKALSACCGRSTVKNVSSMALNSGMGMYGGDLLDSAGDWVEEKLFG